MSGKSGDLKMRWLTKYLSQTNRNFEATTNASESLTDRCHKHCIPQNVYHYETTSTTLVPTANWKCSSSLASPSTLCLLLLLIHYFDERFSQSYPLIKIYSVFHRKSLNARQVIKPAIVQLWSISCINCDLNEMKRRWIVTVIAQLCPCVITLVICLWWCSDLASYGLFHLETFGCGKYTRWAPRHPGL